MRKLAHGVASIQALDELHRNDYMHCNITILEFEHYRLDASSDATWDSEPRIWSQVEAHVTRFTLSR
jgi:hypothetical protein